MDSSKKDHLLLSLILISVCLKKGHLIGAHIYRLFSFVSPPPLLTLALYRSPFYVQCHAYKYLIDLQILFDKLLEYICYLYHKIINTFMFRSTVEGKGPATPTSLLIPRVLRFNYEPHPPLAG